jgi:hypothetical protein
MESHTRNGSIAFDVPGTLNQPPQIFGGFNSDGSPAPPVLPGPIFQDHGDVGSADENDPKRRRIARVCGEGIIVLQIRKIPADREILRHATCVGEKKSNVMGVCQNAHTV